MERKMKKKESPVTGAELRLLRESMSMTQEEAANLMDMTVRGWQKYEYGVTPIPKTKWLVFQMARHAHEAKLNQAQDAKDAEAVTP